MNLLMWLAAMAGAAITWLVALANAMSSGPSLPPGFLILTVPLPIVAIVLAVLRLRAIFAAGAFSAAAIGAGIALLIGAISLAAAIATVIPFGRR